MFYNSTILRSYNCMLLYTIVRLYDCGSMATVDHPGLLSTLLDLGSGLLLVSRFSSQALIRPFTLSVSRCPFSVPSSSSSNHPAYSRSAHSAYIRHSATRGYCDNPQIRQFFPYSPELWSTWVRRRFQFWINYDGSSTAGLFSLFSLLYSPIPPIFPTRLQELQETHIGSSINRNL